MERNKGETDNSGVIYLFIHFIPIDIKEQPGVWSCEVVMRVDRQITSFLFYNVIGRYLMKRTKCWEKTFGLILPGWVPERRLILSFPVGCSYSLEFKGLKKKKNIAFFVMVQYSSGRVSLCLPWQSPHLFPTSLMGGFLCVFYKVTTKSTDICFIHLHLPAPGYKAHCRYFLHVCCLQEWMNASVEWP